MSATITFNQDSQKYQVAILKEHSNSRSVTWYDHVAVFANDQGDYLGYLHGGWPYRIMPLSKTSLPQDMLTANNLLVAMKKPPISLSALEARISALENAQTN